jgi:5'-3' exonuclease
MLDEYTKKLNATSLDLGYVSIDPVSYVWKTENIEKGVMRYYFNFFGINNIKISNQDMKMLLDKYIEGLVWVFNYYFNSHTTECADIWYYPYTHAPLLTQLYYFIKNQPKDYIQKLQTNLSSYCVPFEKFFNPTEHLVYVSPVALYPEIIPEKYVNKMNEIQTVDIKKIVNNVWNNESSKEIDCRGVLFLNKCHINDLHIDHDIKKSNLDDQKLIELLRS